VTTQAVSYWIKHNWLPPFDIDEGNCKRFWKAETINAWESPLARKYLVA